MSGCSGRERGEARARCEQMMADRPSPTRRGSPFRTHTHTHAYTHTHTHTDTYTQTNLRLPHPPSLSRCHTHTHTPLHVSHMSPPFRLLLSFSSPVAGRGRRGQQRQRRDEGPPGVYVLLLAAHLAQAGDARRGCRPHPRHPRSLVRSVSTHTHMDAHTH